MIRSASLSVVMIIALLVAIIGVRTAPGDAASAVPAITQTHAAGGEMLDHRQGHAHHAGHVASAERLTDTSTTAALEGEAPATAAIGSGGDCGGDPHHMGDTCCSFACHAVVDLSVHDGALVPVTHATGDGRISHAVVLGHVPGPDRPPRAA